VNRAAISPELKEPQLLHLMLPLEIDLAAALFTKTLPTKGMAIDNETIRFAHGQPLTLH
jgi:hypothetical protein